MATKAAPFNLKKRITVTNQFGLHARVATSVAKAMERFVCHMTIKKDDQEADARSVLGLLLLAATPGSEITLLAAGPDSEQAVLEISKLFSDDQGPID
jgi:phosphotransferase system HPr (HPr) family protein